MAFGLSLAVSIAAAQVVEIADPGLESAIRTTLGKPTGEITAADMESITELRADRASRDASYGAIKSLRGIEAATNLLVLDLGGELGPDARVNIDFEDFTPLSQLPKLSGLSLEKNALTHFNLPSGLTNLSFLWLQDNRLTSLTNVAFPEDLTNLAELNLDRNQIRHFLPREQLRHLWILNINGNLLDTLALPSSMSNLYWLSVRGNQLTDLVIPSTMAGLWYLDVSSNRLSDLELPTDATALHHLEASQNCLTNVNLPPLLPSLTRLDVGANDLATITLPDGMTNVTDVDLRDNQLRSLALPDGLVRLSSLWLNGNPLLSVSVPFGMNLDGLTVYGYSKDQIGFHAGRLQVQGGELTWGQGILQFAPSLDGSWTDLPHLSPAPLGTGGGSGFYRVRIEE
jgi:internalin A